MPKSWLAWISFSRAVPGWTRLVLSCGSMDGHERCEGAARAAPAMTNRDRDATARNNLRICISPLKQVRRKKQAPLARRSGEPPYTRESAMRGRERACGRKEKRPSPRRERGARCDAPSALGLLHVQGEVVDHEGGLQRAVLRGGEEDLDGLTGEREH